MKAVKLALLIFNKQKSLKAVHFQIQAGPKNCPILFFPPKLCFTIFFPYFSGGGGSRPGRFFWHQHRSKWTIYYAAADKNHWGVRLDDFYRLLRSKSSSWIHIGIKRISQACCLYHLKNMGKKCKTQLWDEKQNRALFWTTLYIHCWKQ